MEFDPGFTATQAAGMVFLLAMGAAAGCWCERVARAYAQVLAGGGSADAVSLRQALWHGTTGRGAMDAYPDKPARARRIKALCALLMALAVAASHIRYGYSLYFMTLVSASAMLLLLALIDARLRLLPDALTLPLLWLGLALAWAGHGIPLSDAVAGAMAGYGALWLLFWLFKWLSGREGMGYGDFKLLAALGAWLGWRELVVVLLVACLAGIVFAMCRQKSLAPSGSYPFGPFLAVSGMAAQIAGSGVHLHFW